MDLIDYTINWVNGEIFEAKVMAVFGVLIILCSILFWRLGTTPYAKALVIPVLVVGCIPLFFGISGVVGNNASISYYEKAWEENHTQYIVAEKERVESFENIFKYSYPMAVIFLVGGGVLFFLSNSPNVKAISLAMMMLGLMAYFVDHFAAERAQIYLDHINRALETVSKT